MKLKPVATLNKSKTENKTLTCQPGNFLNLSLNSVNPAIPKVSRSEGIAQVDTSTTSSAKSAW